MNSARKQLLRNPDIQPAGDVIQEALGEANDAYLKFVQELARHEIQLVWRYYTDGKAWLAKGIYQWTGPRGGQKEKTVFWLSIWDGFFRVTIYVPEKVHADAASLPIDDAVRKIIANSKKMGKLNYFPLVFDLYSDELFGSIYTLTDFRKSI